ncbi:MAG: hypothetical protein B7X69_06055 [Sulfurovum sp. 39-42-12]|nr:MAG: hypothetical protein B7X69_06055 [Sulfurovum sp. 39-42-12]
MKKVMMFLASLGVVVGLNGCGGGGGDSGGYVPPAVTYYLQTYNPQFDIYEPVADVYYECGPDIVGYTTPNGAFTMIEGDSCTFYDLDYTLSYEYDLLYIGANVVGDVGVANIRYDCDSGISDTTDELGTFVFDPEYISSISDGDVCGFQFQF